MGSKRVKRLLSGAITLPIAATALATKFTPQEPAVAQLPKPPVQTAVSPAASAGASVVSLI
jgi:hypothetical protein